MAAAFKIEITAIRIHQMSRKRNISCYTRRKVDLSFSIGLEKLRRVFKSEGIPRSNFDTRLEKHRRSPVSRTYLGRFCETERDFWNVFLWLSRFRKSSRTFSKAKHYHRSTDLIRRESFMVYFSNRITFFSFVFSTNLNHDGRI